MKRLWIAVVILFTMLGSTLGNSWYLNGLISDSAHRLTSAQELAVSDNWEDAIRLTEQVVDNWEQHDFYLHIMLPHRDIDDIHLTLREVQEYLKLEETDQYTAANAKLVAQLGLLGEMEQLNWKNVL